MNLETPYYLIDERKLLRNLKLIKRISDTCGAKSVLALKCFSTWSVFKLMKEYMDGVTASSVYEARLGHEKFGKELHVYSAAYSREDIDKISKFADKIIFNSISQLKMFSPFLDGCNLGLRLNPRVSYSHFNLADPARKYSRLGVVDTKSVFKVLPLIKGVMFHFNCENDDFRNFASNLGYIACKYKKVLKHLEWISLGGGIYFTKKNYPVKKFCQKLKDFSRQFKIQVFLEPGESAITDSAELVSRVLDIVHNKIDIAVVDASTEAHMLDLLVYRSTAKIKNSHSGRFKYMIAGRSCLAGDVFGIYKFKAPLKIGGIVKFSDAAGYTIVKKNWFNGLKMPAIVVKRLNGKIDVVREFKYNDFLSSLS